MTRRKDFGNCEECGNPLKCYQTRFCSRACTGAHNYKKLPILHKICKVCGKKFDTKVAKQQCCCTSCGNTGKTNKTTKSEYDRPYEKETKYLILMWYNGGKGNSKVEIAQILGRSLESVEKAFV